MKFAYRSIKELIQKANGINHLTFMFILAFLIWIFAFREFLSGRLTMVSDALAYYEHIRFFIENISRGVYPMWESSRNDGVPVEFFMRRIGSFNPLYLFILIPYKMGFSYIHSYFMILACYYFVGMIGFYLIALRIFQDQKAAFLAFLLLMFSSLGTRLFDSYFLLTSIPLIWFFYFLMVFTEKRERFPFLGMTFMLMILLTTYIPFYFVTIILVFLVCVIIFYSWDLKGIGQRYLQFFKGHKIFVSLCTLVIIISLIPGLLFYVESGRINVLSYLGVKTDHTDKVITGKNHKIRMDV